MSFLTFIPIGNGKPDDSLISGYLYSISEAKYLHSAVVMKQLFIQTFYMVQIKQITQFQTYAISVLKEMKAYQTFPCNTHGTVSQRNGHRDRS